jgi:cytochrome P450
MQIPSPPTKPLMGHLHLLTEGKNKCFYRSLEKVLKEHGDIVKLNLGPQKWIIVGDGELSKQLFIKNHQKFIKGKTLDEAKAINIGRQGLTMVEGEDWKKVHSIYSKYFSKNAVKATADIANSVGRQATDFLTKFENQELLDLCNRMAFAFIAKVACDYDSDLLTQEKVDDPIFKNQEVIGLEFLKRLKRTPLWKYMPTKGNFQARKAVKEQRDMFSNLIDQYKANKEKNEYCILNQFLEASEDQDYLIDNIWTVLGGAFESTGAALHWFFYEMYTSPSDLERVRKEFEQHLEGDHLSIEGLEKCSHFRHCLMENLRLHNPFGLISREADEDCQVGEYEIKKGEFVISLIGRIATHEKYWGEDSDDFRPSRFEDEHIQNNLSTIYAPFGYGPRKCIGERMSLHEQSLLAAHVLRKFDFDLTPGQEISDIQKFARVSINGIRGRFRKRD